MAKKAKNKKSLSFCASTSASEVSNEKMILLNSSKELERMGQQTRMSGVVKRRSSGRKPAVQKKKKEKIDAKKPKKPPTAFFYFLEDFRKEFQEKNPDIKSMRDIGKACGEKWKTMTYEEKVQYYDIATEKRAEFDRAIVDYNKRKENGEDEETDEDTEYGE